MPEGVTIVIGSVMMILGMAGSMEKHLRSWNAVCGLENQSHGGVRGVRLITESPVIDHRVCE